MTDKYVTEQILALPLNDVLMLSSFITEVNRNILKSHEATGKYLVIPSCTLDLPESRAYVVLTQDDVTGMVSINRIKNLDVE